MRITKSLAHHYIRLDEEEAVVLRQLTDYISYREVAKHCGTTGRPMNRLLTGQTIRLTTFAKIMHGLGLIVRVEMKTTPALQAFVSEYNRTHPGRWRYSRPLKTAKPSPKPPHGRATQEILDRLTRAHEPAEE